MESDSSYQKTEACNINGMLFWVHHTARANFCHFRIQPQAKFWVWTSKNVGPYLKKMLLLFLLLIASIFKFFDCEVTKAHVATVILGVVVYCYFNYYSIAEEDLICIKDLGIQLSSVYFTGRELKEFIPKKLIADVVVNEVFYIQRIIYVLTVLVSKTEDTANYHEKQYAKIEKVITLFKGTKPRLKTLKLVLTEARRVLFDGRIEDEEFENDADEERRK